MLYIFIIYKKNMAKKTTNTKSSTKKVNKVKEESKVVATTSELIIENNDNESECTTKTELLLLDDVDKCVEVAEPLINDFGVKEDVTGKLTLFNEDFLNSINEETNTITMPCDERILKSGDKDSEMYKTNIIVDMNIKELVVYKEAIDKLISHHTNLCEMNRGFDDKVYSESLSILNKLHGYLSRVNNAIKNKIFSLE